MSEQVKLKCGGQGMCGRKVHVLTGEQRGVMLKCRGPGVWDGGR